MSLNSRLSKFGISLLLILLVAASGVTAQSKKSAKSSRTADKKSAKKSDDKKSAKNTRDTKSKGKKDDVASKSRNSKKDSKKDKESTRAKNDRRDSKKDRASAKDNRRDKSSKDNDRKETASTKGKKLSRAEARKEAAARRRAEEERRQAILAEQRRRAEAARIARERFLAFQRGLRTETEQNIAEDNTEGEDLRVRAAAVNALGDKAGTVVVMEAQTGKVLTIVNQDWAIRTAYRPCSTIKLVTGVAGLTENVINDEGTVGESGGGMSLDTALARSNNQYFQRVGQYLGNGKMISYAKKLGLGEPTGINAEGETAGRLPYGNNNAKIYSHGDDFELSPLQLAVLASEIANGGKRVVPQIPKGNFEKAGFRPHIKDEVNLPQQDLEGVIPGMIGAAEWGTAHRGVDATLGIAGKTGSCITKGTWIGLFTSVAPIENPKYAVAVITRGASERGKYAAAVAGRVYQALAPQIRPARNIALAEARFKNKSRVPSNVANKVADEDEDDADDMAAGSADDAAETNAAAVPAPQVVAPQYRQPAAAQPVQKPLVNKIVQSKPKFSPVVITYKKDEDEANDNPEQKSTGPKTSVPAGQRPRVVKNK
jgi:hypothetical protein